MESNNSTHGGMNIVQIGKSLEKMHRRMDAKHDLIVRKNITGKQSIGLKSEEQLLPIITTMPQFREQNPSMRFILDGAS